jgi:hypothetical protein
MLLPFNNWTPDLPSLAGGGGKAFNVLPAKGSYRPVSDLTAYTSNGLAARCQGGAAFLDNAGNVNAFAGDATKLYRMTGGSTAFADVSGATYATPSDGMWRFAGYGNQILATNFTDAVQLFTIGVSAAFADLSASAPRARHACIVKNFAMLANTDEGTFGAVPYGLWWSKQGDVTSWPTPGTDAAIAALSDRRELAGDTGWIQGLAPGLAGADLAILTERGLFRGMFVGGDLVWSFDLVEGARGTPAPGSLVQTGGLLYYLGEDGFYAFNGVQATGIGNSQIDKFFYSNTTHGVDQANLSRVSAIADPINKIVMWGYPSVSSSTGELDRVIVYNWETGGWSLITGLSALDFMMQARSLGYSLDTLDGLSGSVDALPFSLDSRQLTGGRLLIGAIGAADHVLYTFSGSTLAATVTTTEQGHPTGQRMSITEAWPLVEGTSVTPTITPLTRNRQEDAATTGAAVSMNTTGLCPLRINARYVAAQVDIPAGSTWTHATGLMIPDEKIVPVGYR